MYCDSFQKAYAADPEAMDQSFFEHENQCLKCRTFVKELQILNKHLPSAIGVDVPERLADDLLRIPSLRRDRAYASGATKFAIAATVVMVIGLAYLQNQLLPNQPAALPEMVYEHIMHEPGALAANKPIRAAVLRSTMNDFGVPLRSRLENVVHLTLCPIGNTQAIHMTVSGQRGPVSVLLLLGVNIDKRMPVEFDKLVGYIVPGRPGSVAIVGNENEALEKVESEINSAIDWF